MSIADAFLYTSKNLTKFAIAVATLIPIWIFMVYNFRMDLFAHGIWVPACISYFISLGSMVILIGIEFKFKSKDEWTFDSILINSVYVCLFAFSTLVFIHFIIQSIDQLKTFVRYYVQIIFIAKLGSMYLRKWFPEKPED